MLLQRTERFFWIFLTRLRVRERWDYLFCVPFFNHLKNGISSLKFKLFWIKNVGEIIIQHNLFIELKILQHLESSLKLFIYSLCVTMCACTCVCVYGHAHMHMSGGQKKKSQELVLSFYYKSSTIWTQAVRFDNEYLYTMTIFWSENSRFLIVQQDI